MYDSVPGWPAWVSQAVCAGEHIDTYDVDNMPRDPRTRAKYAQLVCHGCPVKRECAIDALQHDTRGVVRGGFAFPESADAVSMFRERVAVVLGVPLPTLLVDRSKAARTECSKGHLLTVENTIVRTDGARLCRRCRTETKRAEWAREKAARARKSEQEAA